MEPGNFDDAISILETCGVRNRMPSTLILIASSCIGVRITFPAHLAAYLPKLCQLHLKANDATAAWKTTRSILICG